MNGHLSDPVHIERGVRQGCPLLPALYVLYVPVFVNFFLKNKKMQGLSLPDDTTVRISAYTDDLLLFCSHRKDIDAVFRFFEKVRLALAAS